MGLICPYCDIEITDSSVESEDGCCPECGAVIGASSIFSDVEDYEEEENPLEEEDDLSDLEDENDAFFNAFADDGDDDEEEY